MEYLAKVVEVSEEEGNPKPDNIQIDGTKTGGTLEQIWVWVGKHQVRGLDVWFTDGNKKKYGTSTGDLKKFTFEDGEHFSALSLWPNADKKHLGAIKFKTNHGREFFAHMKSNNLEEQHTEVPVDVASGICIGIKGRSDGKIVRLGFMFLKTIKSTELIIVEYPNLLDMKPKVTFMEIKSMTYWNNTSEPQKYTIDTSKKIIKKSLWTTSQKMQHVFNISVKATIPQLLETTAGYQLIAGNDSTYPLETTEEKMELFSFPVNVPKNTTLDVDITLGQATFNVSYNGLVKVTCHDGNVLEFKTSGTYKGVAYTAANIAVNESSKKLAGASHALTLT